MAAGRVTTPPGATAYKVQFSPKHSPGYTHVGSLTDESASKASELLMLNHAKYHTLFNEVGLHSEFSHLAHDMDLMMLMINKTISFINCALCGLLVQHPSRFRRRTI